MVYIDFMIRRNVHLTPQQLKKLAELSKQTGLPMAELIRRAIDEYLRKQNKK